MFNFIKEKIFGRKNENKKNIKEEAELNEVGLTDSEIEKAFEELDKGRMAPPDSWHIELLNNLHEKECDGVDLSIIKNKKINESSDKLEGKEILFLDYINGRDFNNKKFPKYWTFRHRLPLQKTVEKLHENNLIRKGDLKSSLNGLTVKEIQEILRENKLKVSGRKSELIDRVVDEMDEVDLMRLSLPDIVVLTEKGKNVIERNRHLFLNIGLSLDHIENIHEKGITDFHEYAISIHQEKREENLKNCKRGLARNNLLSISGVYRDKGDKHNQLRYLIKVFAEDVFEDMLSEYYIKKKLTHIGDKEYNRIFGKIHNYVIIAPGIINPIKKLSKELGLSDLEIEQIIYDHMENLPMDMTKNQFDKRMELIKNNMDRIGEAIKTI